MVQHGLLHRVQLAVLGQPLHGGDMLALHRGGQDDAGVHCLPLQDDGTGAALAHAAAFFGSGKAGHVADDVQQAGVLVDLQGDRLLIEDKM